MKLIFTLPLLLFLFGLQAQSGSIKGQLQDTDAAAVAFANVVLYNSADSAMVKVETSDESGVFQFRGLNPGNFFLVSSYVGLPNLRKSSISLAANEELDLGVLSFAKDGVALEEVTVTAARAMVEVKPDRTVFNVQGTINSTGADAMSLLRKAPGVTVDNNDNINVLGRSGVLLYIDGKRMPLSGEDLTAYLQNLTAEQIDRIDIITNPSARYEAEGNAGIIDIRLKRDKNHGANGSVNATYSKGRHARYNLGGSGNYRNKLLNTFGSLGFADGETFNDMVFESFQNGLFLDETNDSRNTWQNYNFRLGTDFFVAKNHTIGFLVGGMEMEGDRESENRIFLSQENNATDIDSLLVANNFADDARNQYTFNLNYRYDDRKTGRTLNIDLDYGRYQNESVRFQPNRYYDPETDVLKSEVLTRFDTPTDIDISTAKVDYEQNLLGGKIGVGSKLSRVVTDNVFQFYNEENGVSELNKDRSNQFKYEENVYAGYVTYARPINQKWNFSAGLRTEVTDAEGDLKDFDVGASDTIVYLNYTSFFPNAGLTWQVAPMHSLALNYGRRINRPDYNVLNPFENRLSELSFQKGNPSLSPEIVNNVELGYTYAYRYNFKLAYSLTTDPITRLIQPSDLDPRAGFITWANLDEQTVISANLSAPMQIAKKWNAYFNLSASYLDNQAVYDDGAVVDLQAFTYSIYQQHTFDLPMGFKGEISGYFSGPGVWGGVFEYETSWSLNFGLQRKFLQDQLNVRLSANDVFYESGWDGISEFDGLISTGSGRWDSRRVSVSVSYNFGNQNVKSRRRKSGLEDEAGRVGDGS